MKKFFVLILISILLVACITKSEKRSDKEPIDRPNTEWTEVISEKGNFKIQFPNLKLKEGTNTYADEELGEIENHFYRLNIQDSSGLNTHYDITYTFRPDLKTKAKIEEMFDYQKEYLASTLNADIDFVKVLKDKECLGRELLMTIDSSKIKLTQRIYFNKGILYYLQVLTDMNKGKLFNKSTTKFMDSFEILK